MSFTPVGEVRRAVVPCAFVFFVDCESGSGASLDARGCLGWVLACWLRLGLAWFRAWLGWSVFGLRWVSDPYALWCEPWRYDRGLA